jgi:NADPH-dependent ferric siderophore reductase
MMNEQRTPTRRPVPDDLFGGRLRGAYLLDLEVIDLKDPAPHVRRVTMESSDLVDFAYTPGQDVMIEFPHGEREVRRRYTIRRADPAVGIVEFEFELHTNGGVATRWAAEAALGDHLNAIGPRGTMTVRQVATAHVDAGRRLFVADDSAMPAAFAMLEALPPLTPAISVLVTPHGPLSRPGPNGARADIRQIWIEDAELEATIGSLDLTPTFAAYVIGEHHLVRRATELLVSAGLGPAAISAKSYWRNDQPNALHGEPAQD